MIIQNINNQMDAMLEALKPSTPDINLSGREHELAMKEAEQASKDIDWSEFDKQDQIIMSSND